MSIESMSLVLNRSKSRGTDKLVLLGIASHDGDGGAYPSLTTLARYANCTESTVRRSLRSLEAMGELVTHLNQGGSHRTRHDRRPNLYEITISTGSFDGGARTHGRGTRRGRKAAQNGGAPTRGELSLEPPSNESSLVSGAVPLSAAEYFKLHPDEAPRIARWITKDRA